MKAHHSPVPSLKIWLHEPGSHCCHCTTSSPSWPQPAHPGPWPQPLPLPGEPALSTCPPKPSSLESAPPPQYLNRPFKPVAACPCFKFCTPLGTYICFLFICLGIVFCFFMAVPTAYGSSQARDWVRASAAALHYSGNNPRPFKHCATEKAPT